MVYLKNFLALLFVFVCVGCLAQQEGGRGEAVLPSTPSKVASNFSEADYRLGPGDKIRVLVFGETNLSGEFEVSDSGGVDLPLIGTVSARGITVRQFQESVTGRLRAGYLNSPKVSVQVLTYRPFFIVGEVQKGGEYPYKAGLTVQDAVAIAGGYTYRARLDLVYIRKAGTNEEMPYDLSQRVVVNPGDNVRIPERFF